VDRETKRIIASISVTKQNAPDRAQQVVQVGDVIFGTTRPTLQRYCIIPERFDGQVASTGFCVLRPNREFVSPKYLFYLLGLTRFNAFLSANEKGASYPAISNRELMRFRVPIPPLAVQEAIVSILDKFDALVKDLSNGLPAEIEARRRQYDYYRDRLLTFKESA